MDYFPVVVGSDLPTRAICTIRTLVLFVYICVCMGKYITVLVLLVSVETERGREREGLYPSPRSLHWCPPDVIDTRSHPHSGHSDLDLFMGVRYYRVVHARHSLLPVVRLIWFSIIPLSPSLSELSTTSLPGSVLQGPELTAAALRRPTSALPGPRADCCGLQRPTSALPGVFLLLSHRLDLAPRVVMPRRRGRPPRHTGGRSVVPWIISP